ncbi:hypothetical protein JOL62DRAFT_589123 [Phyllosticta paracitricarpa]|uniref:Uncharacterized protein n=2 Tax=Phyllosticta TaxID=121621 RepID=A0ABR1L785_9PEZI
MRAARAQQGDARADRAGRGVDDSKHLPPAHRHRLPVLRRCQRLLGCHGATAITSCRGPHHQCIDPTRAGDPRRAPAAHGRGQLAATRVRQFPGHSPTGHCGRRCRLCGWVFGVRQNLGWDSEESALSCSGGIVSSAACFQCIHPWTDSECDCSSLVSCCMYISTTVLLFFLVIVVQIPSLLHQYICTTTTTDMSINTPKGALLLVSINP